MTLYAVALTSDDSGETWTEYESGTRWNLESVAFDASSGHAIAVGSGGTVLTSDDNGETWTKRESGVSAHLHSVAFDAGSGRAIAVGIYGTVLTSDDDGKTWTKRESGASAWLTFVAFDAGSGRAIAVGEGGTVLTSDDNGETWTERASGASAWLNSVVFDAGTGRAIAVGGGGTVLTSDDNGETWTERESGVSGSINFVEFDARTARAILVGIDGIVLTSEDNGETWTERASGALLWLNSVVFDADTERAIAVGRGGTVLISGDNGETWTKQESGVSAHLNSVALDAGSGRAIAVGDGGTVLTSADNGETWTKQESGVSAHLNSVAFDASSGRAIAVGDGGTVLTSADNGETWTKQESGVSAHLNSVALDAGSGRAIAVGSGGTVITSADNGETWTKRVSGTSTWFNSIAFDAGSGRAIAVGNGGTVITSADNGETWTKRESGVSMWLSFVALGAGSGRAIAVGSSVTAVEGNNGTVLISGDNGMNWTEPQFVAPAPLESVAFDAGSGRAIAVGRGGTQFASDDAGATWSIVVHKGRIYPAPLSVLGLLLSLGGLALLLYQPNQSDNGSPQSPSPSSSASARDGQPAPGSGSSSSRIVDLFVSDRPLGPGDPDRLGYGRYVRGLSGLLRNTGTGFPITIAITGEWGVGKSSFMRLLETDLKHNGYFPAWFNAWHDQNEENVLSSLLQAIRKQAIPRIFSRNFRRAIELRVNLLHSRGMIFPIIVAFVISIFLVVVVAVVKGWLGNSDTSSVNNAAFGEVFEIVEGFWQRLATFLATVAGTLFIADRASPFGFNLRRSVATLFGAAPNSVDPAGRHEQLRRDFKNVSHSIGRHLVIFIDDLDRCQPEKVVETLEAVNFLVTAGECAVVMGMDYKRVQHCTGLVRKDLADAHQYLQKLVNVELPIVTERDRVKDLINMSGPPAERRAVSHPFLRGLSWLWGSRVWVIMTATVVVGVVVGLPWFEKQVLSKPPEAVSTVEVIGTPSDDNESSTSTGGELSQKSGGGDPTVKPVAPGSVAIDTTPDVVFWPVGVGLLLILIFGLLFVLHRLHKRGRLKLWDSLVTSLHWLQDTPVVVRDSQSFRTALEIWSDAVVYDDPTPRKFKRFVNRIRYFAAMLHAENEKDFDWMREANLVALAALHHLKIDFPQTAAPGQSDLFRQVRANLAVTSLDANKDEILRARNKIIDKACRMHVHPDSWQEINGSEGKPPCPPGESEVEQFRKLSEGIHV